ncbi:hypothetical protein SCP_0114430 [Sparassis crispa]|uniref:Uncharacterized protein n=1 Tax=Sparassis crispa TaxID=139825 RepID=A0A401G8R0_9APHY|nr:hypothetical protein SCP_0114430 [Sparassis crispa]GBE78554.1 hypothetical protein SCP_0114430 [Sparassis crispa]
MRKRATPANFPIVTTEPLVSRGALYEPTLQLDYIGDYFNLVNAKLVQPEFRDANDNYIAPWKLHDALRPGTIVAVNASLHCWIFQKKSRVRKIYQIHADSLHVLAPSDDCVEIPPVLILPRAMKTSSPTHAAVPVPLMKKIKTD